MAVALAVTLVDYLGRWAHAGLLGAQPGHARPVLVAPAGWGVPAVGLVEPRGGGTCGFRRWRAAVLSVVRAHRPVVFVDRTRHGAGARNRSFSGIPAGAEPVRLAVIADIHWGLFFRDGQLVDLVDRLNALDVDAVMVAGDWTHEPPRAILKAGLAPLGQDSPPGVCRAGQPRCGVARPAA